MHISKSTHLMRLLQTLDVLIATLSYLVVVQIIGHTWQVPVDGLVKYLLITPIIALLSILAGLTRKPRLHNQSVFNYIRFSARYTVIVLGGLLTILLPFNIGDVERSLIVGYGSVAFLFLLANRMFLSWYYLSGRIENEENFLKVLIVGSGPRSKKMIDSYAENSDWGIEIVGILDPQPDFKATANSSRLTPRPLAELSDILGKEVVDEVIICTPRSLADEITVVAEACEEYGICLKYMADLFETESKEVTLQASGNIPVLTFEPVKQDELKLIVKRVLDLLIVLIAMPFMLPLFIFVGLAIKLTSPGPVFFVQQRVGLNKRKFNLIKFRSMHVNAEAQMAEIEHLNEADGPIFKIQNDPRITPFGRFIRRTSIDELPQLINVLLGQMSLIGPRPMSLRDVDKFSLGVQRKRFSVRPGLACLREISGRSALSFERWLELDLKYIDQWSLSLDFKIMLKLIPSVLKGDGAT